MKVKHIILKDGSEHAVTCCELCPCSYQDHYEKLDYDTWRCSLIGLSTENLSDDYSIIDEPIFHKGCPLPEGEENV